MFCSNCGANIPEDAKACHVCGVPVEQPDFQQSIQEQTAEQQMPQEQSVYQQPVYQPPFYQSAAYSQPIPQKQEVPGKGMAVASLVLGIVSILLCLGFVAFLCGVIGLILSIVAMNKAKAVGMKNGMAVAGLVCSCIGVGLMIMIFGLFFIGLFAELSAGGMIA